MLLKKKICPSVCLTFFESADARDLGLMTLFFFVRKKKHKQSSKSGDTFLVADTRLYTLPCRSVGLTVGRSVGHIFEFRAVFVLLLLPNRPRLDCRVSGLVFRSSWVICLIPLTKNTERYAFEKFTQFCLPFTFHSLICASIN